MPCDSGPATDIGVLMGKCLVPRYDRQGFYLRLIVCCPGEGRTGRAPRSSSGPTSVVFNLVYGRPYPAYRPRAPLPPLPLFVCFSRGGLGVGEKPTRGELVRRLLSPPSDFLSRPFG